MIRDVKHMARVQRKHLDTEAARESRIKDGEERDSRKRERASLQAIIRSAGSEQATLCGERVVLESQRALEQWPSAWTAARLDIIDERIAMLDRQANAARRMLREAGDER